MQEEESRDGVQSSGASRGKGGEAAVHLSSSDPSSTADAAKAETGSEPSKPNQQVPVVESAGLYANRDWERALHEHDAEWRQPIMRDWARVIHSASFRRLQGKTQVFPGHESDFFRNRLTHSLEVAQIAEGIAQKLNFEYPLFRAKPINERLCMVAALIHDLGHPPFGHNGERALDHCMRKYGGFEGNAQTIRIVTKLEKKRAAELDGTHEAGDLRLGLNLTFRTIASALKYDDEIPQHRPKGAALVKGYYKTESDIVSKMKYAVDPHWTDRTAPFKTIECKIMDIADDIAYSTFDLEDCFKAGFLTPADILASNDNLLDKVAKKVQKATKKKCTGKDVLGVFLRIFQGRETPLSAQDATGSLNDFIHRYQSFKNIWSSGSERTEFSSELVNTAIRSVNVDPSSKSDLYDHNTALINISMREDALKQVEILKHYTYEATIFSARVKVAEFRGYEVVRQIFKALAGDKGFLLMPEDLRTGYLRLNGNTTMQMRAICDFVAGMTDRYALEFYGRLHSDSAQSIFKPLS